MDYLPNLYQFCNIWARFTQCIIYQRDQILLQYLSCTTSITFGEVCSLWLCNEPNESCVKVKSGVHERGGQILQKWQLGSHFQPQIHPFPIEDSCNVFYIDWVKKCVSFWHITFVCLFFFSFQILCKERERKWLEWLAGTWNCKEVERVVYDIISGRIKKRIGHIPYMWEWSGDKA